MSLKWFPGCCSGVQASGAVGPKCEHLCVPPLLACTAQQRPAMASCGVLLLWALPRLVALSLLSCPHPLPTIGQPTFAPGGIPLPERRHQPLGRASHHQRRQLTSILLQAWACSALPLDPMLPSIRWRRRRACWVPRRGRGRFRRRLRRRTGFIGICVGEASNPGPPALAPLSAASGNQWWLMPLGQARERSSSPDWAGFLPCSRVPRRCFVWPWLDLPRSHATAHLEDHAAGTLEGEAPQAYRARHHLDLCSVCGGLVASRFNGAHPRCWPAARRAVVPVPAAGLALPGPSIEAVFADPAPVLRHVPKAARAAWAQCLSRALGQVAGNNTLQAPQGGAPPCSAWRTPAPPPGRAVHPAALCQMAGWWARGTLGRLARSSPSPASGRWWRGSAGCQAGRMLCLGRWRGALTCLCCPGVSATLGQHDWCCFQAASQTPPRRPCPPGSRAACLSCCARAGGGGRHPGHPLLQLWECRGPHWPSRWPPSRGPRFPSWRRDGCLACRCCEAARPRRGAGRDCAPPCWSFLTRIAERGWRCATHRGWGSFAAADCQVPLLRRAQLCPGSSMPFTSWGWHWSSCPHCPTLGAEACRAGWTCSPPNWFQQCLQHGRPGFSPPRDSPPPARLMALLL